MKFLDKYTKYISLLEKKDRKNDSDELPDMDELDAALPDQSSNEPELDDTAEMKKISIPPEGYVHLVRMIAKALVMDIPASEIDTILSGDDVTESNAIEIQEGLESILKTNESKLDNIERLDNINYKKFSEEINENNFIKKYDKLLAIMKKRSPYID